jgi:hypothetical protein
MSRSTSSRHVPIASIAKRLGGAPNPRAMRQSQLESSSSGQRLGRYGQSVARCGVPSTSISNPTQPIGSAEAGRHSGNPRNASRNRRRRSSPSRTPIESRSKIACRTPGLSCGSNASRSCCSRMRRAVTRSKPSTLEPLRVGQGFDRRRRCGPDAVEHRAIDPLVTCPDGLHRCLSQQSGYRSDQPVAS